MQHQAAYQVAAVKSLGQDVIEQYHGFRYAFFQEHVRKAEIIVIVYHVQVLNCLLIRDMTARKANHLVKDGECVTHASVGFFGYDGQGLGIGLHTLLCGQSHRFGSGIVWWV